jgi:nitrate/nitrite-specific signal transduction histidine kinase
MVEVENQEELNKENLLNKLEKMYEESRDIAHEDLNGKIEKEFSVRLFEMISSYSSPQQKVLVIGNEQNIWQSISQNTQSEVYYTLRELMINMKKHSKATLVSVKFEKSENILKIKYSDNGLGMGNVENKKLSGIKNTENRIENIGGEINFEKKLKKGLQINISIPIH